jgi:hypothetical protein
MAKFMWHGQIADRAKFAVGNSTNRQRSGWPIRLMQFIATVSGSEASMIFDIDAEINFGANNLTVGNRPAIPKASGTVGRSSAGGASNAAGAPGVEGKPGSESGPLPQDRSSQPSK